MENVELFSGISGYDREEIIGLDYGVSPCEERRLGDNIGLSEISSASSPDKTKK